MISQQEPWLPGETGTSIWIEENDLDLFNSFCSDPVLELHTRTAAMHCRIVDFVIHGTQLHPSTDELDVFKLDRSDGRRIENINSKLNIVLPIGTITNDPEGRLRSFELSSQYGCLAESDGRHRKRRDGSNYCRSVPSGLGGEPFEHFTAPEIERAWIDEDYRFKVGEAPE